MQVNRIKNSEALSFWKTVLNLTKTQVMPLVAAAILCFIGGLILSYVPIIGVFLNLFLYVAYFFIGKKIVNNEVLDLDIMNQIFTTKNLKQILPYMLLSFVIFFIGLFLLIIPAILYSVGWSLSPEKMLIEILALIERSDYLSFGTKMLSIFLVGGLFFIISSVIHILIMTAIPLSLDSEVNYTDALKLSVKTNWVNAIPMTLMLILPIVVLALPAVALTLAISSFSLASGLSAVLLVIFMIAMSLCLLFSVLVFLFLLPVAYYKLYQMLYTQESVLTSEVQL